MLLLSIEVVLTLGQCGATVHYKFTYPVYEIALFTGTRRFLGAFAKLRKATVSVLSVRPHGTTLLPLDGFSLNLMFGYFSKTCREDSSFIKT